MPTHQLPQDHTGAQGTPFSASAQRASYGAPTRGRVAITTDSVAQVPPEEAGRWSITVVPLIVTIGTQKYRDGVDLSPSELYQRMRAEKVAPTTSAPSVGEYLEAFRSCLHDGADAVVHVSLSGKLSTATNVSRQAAGLAAAEFPEQRIEVLDTLQGAISQGFIAIEAGRAAAQGLGLAEVLERARAAMARTGLVVSLATLEYLARGGRIGKAAYWAGSLINARPLVTLEAGVATPVTRARGERHALQAMIDWSIQKTGGRAGLTIGVMNADAAETAAQLHTLAVDQLHPARIFHSDFTPVMGVHTGPGLVGLGYYFE